MRVARIFELCPEQDSKLKEDGPQRKMKWQRVLLGDGVKYGEFNWADCAGLAYYPRSVEAAQHLNR